MSFPSQQHVMLARPVGFARSRQPKSHANTCSTFSANSGNIPYQVGDAHRPAGLEALAGRYPEQDRPGAGAFVQGALVLVNRADAEDVAVVAVPFLSYNLAEHAFIPVSAIIA